MPGQGSIQLTQKREAPVPATVTGARSGTSLVGTFVELGGAASPFLHNTIINMGLFDFVVRDSVNLVYLEFDQSAGQATIGDQAQNSVFDANMTTGTTSMGDVFNTSGGAKLQIFDPAVLLTFQDATFNSFLSLDKSTGQYGIGDLGGTLNGSSLVISDTAESFLASTNTGAYLSLNVIPDAYNMGAIGFGNSTALLISDNVQQASITSGGFTRLFLDSVNEIYQLGPSAAPVNAYFEVDATNQLFSTASNGVINGFVIDNSNLNYRIGDYAGVGNSSFFEVEDASSRFIWRISGTESARLTNAELRLNNSGGNLLTSITALTNGAGANVGTLLNAPTAGNPTKWVPIVDAGVTRFIPTWQ